MLILVVMLFVLDNFIAITAMGAMMGAMNAAMSDKPYGKGHSSEEQCLQQVMELVHGLDMDLSPLILEMNLKEPACMGLLMDS